MRLRLPPTMSMPTRDEAPSTIDLEAVDRARASARIEPGYRITIPEDTSGFDFHALVNVHTDELWRVFEALAHRLPEPTAVILNERDEAPYLGSYGPLLARMQVLRLFRTELVNDPFLEFGVIHGTADGTEEVFVAYAKYLKVWGRGLDSFRAAMAELGLPEVPELRLVNEFPLAMLSLNRAIDGAAHHSETIERIVDRLDALDGS